MCYENLTIQFIEQLARFRHVKPAVDFSNFQHGEVMVLNYLYENQDSVELPTNISSKLCLSTARVAATLNSLEKKEMITRVMSPNDRRKIIVKITETGNNFVSEKREKLKFIFSKILKKIGEDDSRELIRIMAKLEKAANEVMSTADEML